MDKYTIHCKRCGKEVGPGVFDCYERGAGSCPYEMSKDIWSGKMGLVGLVVLIAMFVCSVGWLVQKMKFSVFSVGIVAVAAIFFLSIVYKSYPGTTLHNPETGAMWYGKSLFGFELGRLVIPPHRPVMLSLSSPQTSYPASIAAMTHKSDAEYVLEVTLLDLLASGVLRVGRSQLYRSSLGGRPRPIKGKKYIQLPGSNMKKVRGEEYSLVPGPNFGETTLVGELERRIINGVDPQQDYREPLEEAMEQARADEKRQVQMNETSKKLIKALISISPGRMGGRRGVIRDVVWRVYDRDENNPGNWLLDLVREDATRHGLGHVKKSMLVIKSFEPDPAHDIRLREAGLRTQSLHIRAKESHPDFLRALQEEVKQGIKSRVDTSD